MAANARSDSSGAQGANSTTWTLTYPPLVGPGDLLMLNVSNDGDATVSAVAAGFEQLFTLAETTNARGTTLLKIAAGTETGNFTLNVSASEQGVWRVASIQNWWGTIQGGVEASAGTTGTATTPSTNMPAPDLLAPSWGAENTFWRAMCALDDGRTTVTTFPANYDINPFSDSSGGATGASGGSAGRLLVAASEQPGEFTIDRSVAWVAWTLAIRPAAVETQKFLFPPQIGGHGAC